MRHRGTEEWWILEMATGKGNEHSRERDCRLFMQNIFD